MGALGTYAPPAPRFLNREQMGRHAAAESAIPDSPARDPFSDLDPLVHRVRKWWSDALDWRRQSGLEARLLKCQRQMRREYEPDVLARIQAGGGCADYFDLTVRKADHFEAWMTDIFAMAEDVPFRLEATPVPDIPDDMAAEIEATVAAEWQQRAAMGEIDPDEGLIGAVLRTLDEVKAAALEEAQTRADRHGEIIHDQLREGGFYAAWREFLINLRQYPTAFLWGPTIENHRRERWRNGEWVVEDEEIPVWHAVDPHDVYPAPHATSVDGGPFLVIPRRIHGQKLARMRGTDGWNAEAIDAVLREGPISIFADVQQVQIQLADADPNYNDADMYEYLDAFGTVRGQILIDAGIPLPPDHAPLEPDNYYEVFISLCNQRHLCRAVLNPDPLGRRRLLSACFRTVAGSIWGEALPEAVRTVQTLKCATGRAMADNLNAAARPSYFADMKALGVQVCEELKKTGFPSGGFIFYDGDKTPPNRDPIQPYQAQFLGAQFQQILDWCDTEADNDSKIPRYEQGSADLGAGASTARGMQMLTERSARGMRLCVANVDTMLEQLVQRQAAWNFDHLDDPDIRGDCRVVARGVLSRMRDTELEERRMAFLGLHASNQVVQQCVDVPGVARVVRALAARLDVGDIVLDEEELERRIELQALQMAEMQAAAGMTGEGDGRTSDAGEAAGAQEQW